MAAFDLKDSVARKLRSLAEQEKRTPEDILSEMIEVRYTASRVSSLGEEEPNPLLKMAEQAQELGLSSGQPDISERSREILNEEFPRYLKARMDRNETDSD